MGGMALGHGFVEGFLKSWGVILASEIGDKTFFIAAILAMRHPRQTVRTHPVAGRRQRQRRRQRLQHTAAQLLLPLQTGR